MTGRDDLSEGDAGCYICGEPDETICDTCSQPICFGCQVPDDPESTDCVECGDPGHEGSDE